MDMRAFAELLDRLSLTASRNAKLVLVRDYLRATPDPDRGWALAALTGDLTFDAAKPAMIRKAVEGRVDSVLFGWSYDYVGDLAETVALIWPVTPDRRPNREPELAEVVEALRTAEPTKTAESARAAAHALFERGMAVLVVHGAFFFVGQGVVGFLNFFKFFFRLFVAGIAVGMVFHRQLAVGFFDFVVARTARHAECCIKILVAHDSDGC